MRPVLFQVGDLAIPSYLLLLVLGTSVFVYLTLRAAARRGVDVRRAALLLGAVWVAAVIGARLLFVSGQPALRADPLRWIFDPSPGGYAIQGGVVLALSVAVVVARWLRLPLATLAHSAIPGLFVAGAAGRLGCFLAGCCYGRPTEMPWGVTFPQTSEAARSWGAGVALHPTQLYEAGFFVVLAALYAWTTRRVRQRSVSETNTPGAVFVWLLIAFFAFRFVVESFRGDPRAVLWGLTSPQWISLIAVAIALLVLRVQKKELINRDTRDAKLQRHRLVASAPVDRRLSAGLGYFALPIRRASGRDNGVRGFGIRDAAEPG